MAPLAIVRKVSGWTAVLAFWAFVVGLGLWLCYAAGCTHIYPSTSTVSDIVTEFSAEPVDSPAQPQLAPPVQPNDQGAYVIEIDPSPIATKPKEKK